MSEHAGRAQIFDKTSEKRSQRLKPAKVTDEGGGWLGVCQAEFRRA
ncbi:hypothetical protein P4V08_07000 [Bacillus subtilis]|nr:hypothetical protein [Bacillus subtilis]MDF4198220.1 hypothetical protein [Bacillus subtilis]MDF4215948.1 hypothetical protein [Bacillus subtilis]MEC2135135.1 hypothetical protein [Bacillus subtilis]MED1777527.1 hypothetical protein [Bacillus subtilis]NRF00325.1 hypothetical protein [Bacillus subtilis]